MRSQSSCVVLDVRIDEQVMMTRMDKTSIIADANHQQFIETHKEIADWQRIEMCVYGSR